MTHINDSIIILSAAHLTTRVRVVHKNLATQTRVANQPYQLSQPYLTNPTIPTLPPYRLIISVVETLNPLKKKIIILSMCAIPKIISMLSRKKLNCFPSLRIRKTIFIEVV